MSLSEQISDYRQQISDERLSVKIELLKSETTPVTATKVVDIAAAMNDLDKLIALHKSAADLMHGHMRTLVGPDL
jgi:hypothetical protein